MTNDTSTLSGALLEMKDQLIYELGQKGVTATYDSTTGLLGLIGRISDIQTGGGGSCYHIEFDSASYVAVGGNVTVSFTLQSNYAPLSNATVTLSDGNSQYSCITNSNGVGTYTFTGFNSDKTLTASYQGVSDSCSVVYSNYYFYDDCSADNSSQYDTTMRYNGTTTVPTLTFSTDHYVFDASSRSDSFCGYVIPNTYGRDNIKISAKVEMKSTSAYCQVGIAFADSLSVANYGAFSFYRIRGDKLIDWVEGGSNATFRSNAVQPNTIYYIELLKESAKCTFNVYDSNHTLLFSDNRNSTNTYSSPYFSIARNMRNTSNQSHIYEIKVEPIS